MTDHDPTRTALRRALAGSADALSADVMKAALDDGDLQLGGDVILAMLRRGDAVDSDFVTAIIENLGERSWSGDAELAAQLAAETGAGPTPALKPLVISLELLAEEIGGDPMEPGGAIDLETGDIWPRLAIEDAIAAEEAEEEDFDTDRWLDIGSRESRSGYHDMADFVATVTDESLLQRLQVAINGKGAFRRFRDVLWHEEDELTRWTRFSDERQQGRARAWLAARGYRPA
jgi:hypothetical protein